MIKLNSKTGDLPMNPFTDERGFYGNYTIFIQNQIEGMEVNESKKIDLSNAPYSKFRATLKYASEKLGFETTTKKAKDGSQWVKRTH